MKQRIPRVVSYFFGDIMLMDFPQQLPFKSSKLQTPWDILCSIIICYYDYNILSCVFHYFTGHPAARIRHIQWRIWNSAAL